MSGFVSVCANNQMHECLLTGDSLLSNETLATPSLTHERVMQVNLATIKGDELLVCLNRHYHTNHRCVSFRHVEICLRKAYVCRRFQLFPFILSNI